MKKIIFVIVAVLFAHFGTAQLITITTDDTEFERCLETLTAAQGQGNVAGDNEVILNNIGSVTEISCTGLDGYGAITSITGVENFTNLQIFAVWQTLVSDLSPTFGLTNMQEIRAFQSQVDGVLNFSAMPNLRVVGMDANNIDGIVFNTGNSVLDIVDIRLNQLTEIELPAAAPLTRLILSNNSLQCGVDISNFLDTLLHFAVCNNADLEFVYVDQTDLPGIGGRRSAETCPQAVLNDQIFGLLIDDATTSFEAIQNDNCQACLNDLNFIDPALELFFLTQSNYDNGYIRNGATNLTITDLVRNNKVCQELVDQVTYLNLTGAANPTGIATSPGISVSSLGGLEFFTNLQFLYAQNNNIGQIDITANTQMVDFRAYNGNGGTGPLQSVNLQNLSNLQIVGLNNNVLDELLLQNNTSLEILNVTNNQLSGDFDFRPFDQILSNFTIDTNPGPLCIQVDDISFADNPNWVYDGARDDIFRTTACDAEPLATVMANDADAVENPVENGQFTITLAEVNNTGFPITVFFTMSGTATEGVDYTSPGASVDIPDGSDTATVDIVPIDDGDIEGDETVILTIDGGAGYDPGTPGTATVTIADDDQEPLATVTANDADAVENPVENGQFTITLAEVNNTGFPITVFFTLSGTATEGVDYTSPGASVDIPDGSDTATVDIVPIDDGDIEGDETVILTIDGGAGYDPGTPGTATVTIADDDQEPLATVTANDADAVENPVENGQFTITLAEVNNTGFPITVFFTLSGTATEGVDYTSPGASVDIPDGSDTATVDIVPIDDGDIEGDETVILTIDGGAGYDPGTPGTATVTIADDDQLPMATIAATDADAVENPADPGTFTVTLDQANNSGGDIFVNYTVGGTATEGTDYTTLIGSVTIANGATTGTVNIDPLDDALVEGPETVILTLTGGTGYTVGTPDNDTVTIADDDQLPTATIAATDADAVENPADPGTFTVTLDQANNSGGDIFVNYTVGGTATEGTDYTTLVGSVTIANGATTGTVSIDPLDDADIEGPETVILTLTGGTGYTVGTPDNDTVTIADDDQLPTATIAATDADAVENPVDPGTFTVTLDQANNSGGDILVNYTVGGTATEGTDYTTLVGSVTIANGATTGTVNIDPLDDADIEGPETVILTLTGGTGYTVGTPDNDTVTIADDDQLPTATIAASDADAVENPADPGTFTVTLDQANNSGGDIFVNYTVGGTATEGTDYTILVGSVTIANGATTGTVSIDPLDDADIEGDETVILTIDNGSGYVPATPSSAIVTISDDDTNQDNSLPDVNENTFSVTILENSCPNTGNGEIQVAIGTTSEQFNLTFNGAAQGTLAQGESRVFDLLPAGQYQIELSIPTKNWVQEFTLALEQAELIQATSVLLDELSESLRMEVVGSESYSVRVNGSEFIFDGFLSEVPALLQIPLEKGRNQVSVQGSKECQGTIEQNVVLDTMLVHPIPSRQWLYIEGLPQDGPITIQIFDLSGRKILEQMSSERKITETIDVSSIPSGQYILDVSGDRVKKTLQFIKI